MVEVFAAEEDDGVGRGVGSGFAGSDDLRNGAFHVVHFPFFGFDNGVACGACGQQRDDCKPDDGWKLAGGLDHNSISLVLCYGRDYKPILNMMRLLNGSIQTFCLGYRK